MPRAYANFIIKDNGAPVLSKFPGHVCTNQLKKSFGITLKRAQRTNAGNGPDIGIKMVTVKSGWGIQTWLLIGYLGKFIMGRIPAAP
jgi:hypothetical protein